VAPGPDDRGPEGLPNHVKHLLYEALVRTKFNQVKAAKVLRVSRETVRKWLKRSGHFPGLITWAADLGLALPEELARLAPLVTANSANHEALKVSNSCAKPPLAEHILILTGAEPLTTLQPAMSTDPINPTSQSTARLEGEPREYVKRVALELELIGGARPGDLSGALEHMVNHLRAKSTPRELATMLADEIRRGKDTQEHKP
jgi:regulatory Fis family protein